jgi:hypothetical protein
MRCVVLSRLQGRRLLPLVVAFCALIVQTGFLLVLPSSARRNESTDYVEYYSPVAQNILTGKGLVDASAKPATLYPPGFPVWLAGIFYIADSAGLERMTVILFANLLLMSLACVLVFWTAERLFNIPIALLSAGLWITYPFNLWLVKQPNSEVPFIPLMYAAIYCTVVVVQRKSVRFAAASGVLFAMAALVRPIALLLPFVAAVAILLKGGIYRKKRVICVAVLVGIYCLALLPWEGKVYSVTSQVVPLSTNGPASILDGLTFIRRSGRAGVPERVADLMQRIWAHHQKLTTTGEIVQYVVSELKQNPGASLELVGIKVVRCWYATDSNAREPAIFPIQLFYSVLGFVGVLLSARRFPEQRYYIVLFVVLVLYFWGMAAAALSILRYLVPAMVYLLIPGAAAVDALLAHRLQLSASHASTEIARG